MDHPAGWSSEHVLMPRQRQVLAKRTQAERKAERKTLGKLRHQVVAEKTEDRYFTQVSRFLSCLNSHGKSYPRSFFDAGSGGV